MPSISESYIPQNYVKKTLPLPSTQDFPLQFQIADGLDGSGSVWIQCTIKQSLIQTRNLSFYSALDQYKSPVVVVVYFGKI